MASIQKTGFFKTTTLKNIPLHDVFNRTCLFQPVKTNDLNQESRLMVYKDKTYFLSISSNNHLNLHMDYPVFAVLISAYINHALIDENISTEITIPLNRLKIIGFSKIKTVKTPKNDDYNKFRVSLSRLKNTHVTYIDVKTEKTVFSDKILETGYIDFSNKTLTFSFNDGIKNLYDLSAHKGSEYTVINVEKLMQLKYEGTKALYRFLRTHSKGYIDFTYEYLSKVLGYHYRIDSDTKRKKTTPNKKLKSKESIIKSYIRKSLQELEDKELISGYHEYKKENHFRILSTRHYPNAEGILDYKSNFNIKAIKGKEKADKLASKHDDDLPLIFQ